MPIKRGKKWQVNIRFGPKFLRPTFDTEVEAKTWEVLAKDARDRGLPAPPVSQALSSPTDRLRPFIDEVFADLWGSNKSARKYVQYTDEIVDFFGPDMELSKITTAEVDRFLTHCRNKGNGDKTLNRKLSVLSKLLKKALAREKISRLPVMERRREGRGRTRYMTQDEENTLLSELWKLGEEQAKYRAQFMIYTGARDGEVRSLQWSDIDGNKITFDGKTGHRTIYASNKAMEALDWSREKGYPKPFPMSYEAFKEAWDKASARMNKLGEPGWVPYIMRHTCASRLVQRGVDIRRVRDWMGHSTIQTTMVYAHLAPDDLEKCLEALDG